MSINLSALMKQRYDTAANWTAQNPTLLAGEIGIESDTKKWKVGTGSTAWTSLTYAIGGTYPIVNADIAAAAAIAYSKLATLTSGNIVLGSAANVATSTAVTGDVTISSTGVTAIAAGVIVNADINASAGIVDTKLATIATAGKVSNSATTAASANTASAIVARDASGNFTAGTITAALTGAASSNVLKAGDTMTGVLAVTAGTAALPGIAVSGDLNTGIYSPSADQIGIATGGTPRITVDGSGNVNIDSGTFYVDAANNRVGIGTTSPSSILHVNQPGDNNGITLSHASRAGIWKIYHSGVSSENLVFFQNNGTSDSLSYLMGRDLHYWATGGTERARIDSSGRLLVGTSSNDSNAKLVCQGYVGGETSVGAFAVRYGSTRPTVADIGIGTIRFESTSNTNLNYHYASISCATDGASSSDTDIPGRLVFSTTADGASTPTERMRITNTGKTWLSSTDSSYGQFQIGNTTSDGEVGITFIPGVSAFGSTPTSANGDSRIWGIGPNIYAVGATQFAIGNKATGYVAKLASNTATSWTFSSDERLKNIEGPVVAATQIIQAINPVYYSFKADSAATRKVGLIAQNVLSVLPEVVDVPEEEQDGEGNQHYMGLAMTDLVPVLIAALKESNLRIKELTDRVAALEGA
jgi:hypothetical protein